MSGSNVRVGGGCGMGRPIIGGRQPRKVRSLLEFDPETEEERAKRVEENARRYEEMIARMAEERMQADAEAKAMLERRRAWDAKVAKLRTDGPPVGGTISVTLGCAAPANVYCEVLNGRPRVWVLIRMGAVYPTDPFFHLGVHGRFGLRAFLRQSDVDRILTTEDRELLDMGGVRYLHRLKIRSVKVIGFSQTRKSVNVELVDWSL